MAFLIATLALQCWPSDPSMGIIRCLASTVIGGEGHSFTEFVAREIGKLRENYRRPLNLVRLVQIWQVLLAFLVSISCTYVV